MTKITSLTFITSNAAKAEQLGRHLNFPIDHVKIDLPEIQSLDLEAVVRRKVLDGYSHVRKPVLVEDTSLIFHALGRLPGPLMKWFLKELDNDGLCRLLDGYDNRSALAQVMFGFFDGKNVHIFAGDMEGTIARKPRGEKGFGWDPIFIPRDYRKTWGEMDHLEQGSSSMRKIALKKLETFLKRNVTN